MSTSEKQNGSRPMNQKLMVLKLKRINELNDKLKESLRRDRIYASNASYSIITYTQEHKDYAIPEIWGFMKPGQNPFRQNTTRQGGQGGSEGGGCCTIM
ncbi:Guanine nucleotide-binding protein subunit gamma [Cyberlindnera fabianii]|uniref:Guanine nucleotide-binding protein subunit gamma n=1 Tax=Cyberlindnera fabianii TaxID=36022 RepID=A0A1V2L1X4_CYBFA|nr:Guanine nucleotide-binding protein subunit gamma [Cyberlindnera fabianii]